MLRPAFTARMPCLVRSVARALFPALGAIGAGACSRDATTGGLPENTAAATATYAAIAAASYEDAASLADALDNALAALVAGPSGATLAAARQAWLDAREPYLATEVFRFYGGPIDETEGFINAWPLDEAYIDYVVDDPDAGIINDPSAEISVPSLEALNEQGGEKNIATGFHAVEFLLWGQDTSDGGPGARPATDYVTGAAGTAANQARRGSYLTTVSQLLRQDLRAVAGAWAAGANDYRASFLALAPEESLRRILTGMIVLSGFETGGERLQTALDSGDQEDEHSCFSDNTHRDMVQDVRGMQNVYRGRYERLDGTLVAGTGVKDVVAAVDPASADELDARIATSLALAEALEPPFDREIALDNPAGRARVQALVISLREQENILERIFRLFELSAPVVE